VKLKPYSGKVWNVRSVDEHEVTKWTLVIADLPEQAIKSFRWEFPGHRVQDVCEHLATTVIVPD